MKKRSALFIVTFFAFSFNIHAQNKAEDIIGIWLTSGKEPAKIQIYRSGEKFYGKIIWLKNPTDNGKQKLDSNNPEKEKQVNPILGLLMLKGFKFDGDDKWEDGDIYDPESSKTYRWYMYLKDRNILKVRGYIGISLLEELRPGQEQIRQISI